MDPENNTPIDDFRVISPKEEDITEELSNLDSFTEYRKHQQKDNLTFGDY